MGKNKHTGWSCVLKTYPKKNFWNSLKKPGVFVIVCFLMAFIIDINPLNQIKTMSSIITSGYPSLIGFIIAGYAIFIGINQGKILKRLTTPGSEGGSSLYQIVSATFCVILCSFVITYMFASVCQIIIENDATIRNYILCCCVDKQCILLIIEYVISICLIFLFGYFVFSLLDVIINLFNYSQYINIISQRTDSSHSEKGENTEIYKKYKFKVFRFTISIGKE